MVAGRRNSLEWIRCTRAQDRGVCRVPSVNRHYVNKEATMFQRFVDVLTMLVVSVVLGGLVGFTMDRLSYHQDIMFDPSVVAGQRILITGASSGVGEQVAYQYAKHGASVFITARSAHRLKQVVAECRRLGALKAEFVEADLVRMVDAEKVVKLASKVLGGLDHVILGHAYFPSLRSWSGSRQEFDDLQMTFDINVKSYIHLTTHALPELERTNGSIGVINSVAGKMSVPLMGLYTMSKHALDGFFSTLRLELRHRRVNVSISNFILGGIDTQRKRLQLEQAERDLDLDLGKSFRDLVPAADAGHVILRGMSTREDEIFYPQSQDVKLKVLLRDWFPSMSHVSIATQQRKTEF